MRKINFTCLLLCMALPGILSACGGRSGSGKTATQNEETREAAAIDDMDDMDDESEDFNTFFIRFKADDGFLKSRTLFPFVYESHDPESDEPIIAEMAEEEWESPDFNWDPSYAERETDAYTQEITTEGDITIIRYNGVENGINVQAVFIRIDGQWYFQKIIDHSV